MINLLFVDGVDILAIKNYGHIADLGPRLVDKAAYGDITVAFGSSAAVA